MGSGGEVGSSNRRAYNTYRTCVALCVSGAVWVTRSVLYGGFHRAIGTGPCFTALYRYWLLDVASPTGWPDFRFLFDQ